MTNILLDTNYLVRYFVNDIKPLAKEAAQIINKNNIFISSLSVAEAVYVLETHYKSNKSLICDGLLTLLNQSNVSTESFTILALQIFESENISIYDSLLASEAISKGLQLKTFDKKLEKVYKKYSQN